MREGTWTLCSNHVEPTERTYTVTDLLPATEYELKITAHNNAGDTVAIYNFTTYTLTGGKFTKRFQRYFIIILNQYCSLVLLRLPN